MERNALGWVIVGIFFALVCVVELATEGHGENAEMIRAYNAR